MATITELQENDRLIDSRQTINTNFTNLNNDVETLLNKISYFSIEDWTLEDGEYLLTLEHNVGGVVSVYALQSDGSYAKSLVDAKITDDAIILSSEAAFNGYAIIGGSTIINVATDSQGRVIDTTYASLDAIRGIIGDMLYPVGSIYISALETNPTTLFGGEWQQIKDRFLLASGDEYQNASEGGEATHTLTVNEMAKHGHIVDIYTGDATSASFVAQQLQSDGVSYATATAAGTIGTNYSWKSSSFKTYGSRNVQGSGDPLGNAEYTGGGQAHNNMPPYLAVYVWKRIA